MTIGNGISFSGLASGLDTRAIIDQLMALERLPIQALEAERDEARAKLDLVGTFGNLVRDLQDRAEVLADASRFLALDVSSSQEGIANVGVSGSAEAGSHSIVVESTASVDRWAFDGVVDPDRNLSTSNNRRVTFDVNGTSYDIAIDRNNSSIIDIMNAIEAEAGDDVEASVVNSGTVENPSHQLVLASRNSGSAYTITNLRSTVQGLDLSAPDVANITVGGDAVALIDGLRISRSDNDFGDVIQGVSIDLISASPTELTITVDSDREVVRAQVDEFITAYNEIVNFVNAQSTYSEDAGAGGLLFGDSILSSVQRGLRSALAVPLDTVMNDSAGYSTLSLVGIRQQSDGTLQLDESVFTDKMNEDLAALAGLFVDYDGFDNGGANPEDPDFTVDITADDGLADNLVRTIERMFGTYEGIVDPRTGERVSLDSVFKAREESINDRIGRLGDQIESKERRLESYEAGLVRQYAALEELLGSLNAQGAALSSALLSLPSPQQ